MFLRPYRAAYFQLCQAACILHFVRAGVFLIHYTHTSVGHKINVPEGITEPDRHWLLVRTRPPFLPRTRLHQPGWSSDSFSHCLASANQQCRNGRDKWQHVQQVRRVRRSLSLEAEILWEGRGCVPPENVEAPPAGSCNDSQISRAVGSRTGLIPCLLMAICAG